MAGAGESDQERTEAPTERRRQRAREDGKVAKSPELTSAALVVGGAVVLFWMAGARWAQFAMQTLHQSAHQLSAGPLTALGAIAMVRSLALGLVMASLPFAIALMVVVVVVGMVQTRGLVSFKALEPKFSNLNPANGIKRMFSADALVNLLKSLAKLAVLGLVTTVILRGSWERLISLAAARPTDISGVLSTLTFRLVLLTGSTFLVIAAIDYIYQHVKFERSLRMTKQDIIQEHKEAEGDPQIKSRIQALARARARARMLQAIPTADVIITNPTHIAVALRYNVAESAAPVVVAMGQRKLAERIKAIAREHNIPLVENKPVARALLATCVVSKAIPPALYAAVAEILAYVYRLRGGLPGAGDALRGRSVA